MKLTKKTIATIALILVLTIAAILVALPTATAKTTMTTYPFIGAMPNPVGLNQPTLLHIGILEQLQNVKLGWEGLTVSVEKPDGTTETLGPFRTDATGGMGTVLVPTMVGTYRLQTHFPEQLMPEPGTSRTPAGTVMEASDSEVLELVVQEEPLPDYPATPLPEEYWTRPIDAQHRDWYTIAGNWLEGATKNLAGIFAPYNDYAPETAHILWTKPYATGGLVGGPLGPHAYEDGDAYQGYGDGSVIINGIYIYNEAPNPTGWGKWDPQWNRITAVDLRTGEELWSKSFGLERVAFAQTMLWDSFNNHGAFPYVYTTVGNTWKAYDPRTGQWVFTMENVPRGVRVQDRTTRARGPKGEILLFEVDTKNGWMALWNSTNIPALYGAQSHPTTPEFTGNLYYTVWGNWWPWNKTVDATGPVEVSPEQPLGKAGYTWNVTIPTGLPGSVAGVSLGDKILGVSYSDEEISSWSLSLEEGQKGALLHSNTWQAPAEWKENSIGLRHLSVSFEDDVFVIFAQQIRTWYAFDINTGDFLWKTDSQNYLDHYQYINHASLDYGNLYSVSIGGIVYCYDLDNGELKWTYEVTDPYNEFNWANNWAMMINFVTDGKIYMGQEMHSPIDPKPRGGPYVCLDAITGDVIWRADGMFRQTEWGGHAIIGDSIIVTMDTYDQRIYAIGKGPSATTVTASPEVSVHGSSVLVKGMVTDVSPGTEDYALRARFPHGVPAVADGSMSDWMLYVYKQFERPTDATGVTVKIEAYDPNGNYQNLGTATSDSYGNYGFVFEPEVPGTYWISATFEGSNGYYGSQSTTYIQVDAAPSPAQQIEPELTEGATSTESEFTNPDPPEPTTAEAPFITTEVAILAAVAVAVVIGIAAYWILRKRK